MSAGKLPEGWVVSTIGEVCDINPKHKHDDDLDIGFMPMADVPTNYLGACSYETRKWKDVKKGFTQFANNDVIFAKITPCFENGKAAVINNFPSGYGAGSTEYFVLRSVSDRVNPYLLLALVKSKEFLINGALNMSGSVGHKRVPKEFVEKYELPIPPRAEQKIIAEKLDTLLAQVDSTKARLEEIPKILKRFRQAVLGVAVSGKLTNRSDEYQNWQELPLNHIASHVVDCPHSTPKWSSEGKYCVRTTAFSPFNLVLSNQGYVDEKTYLERIQRLKPEADDILYSREGTVGIACQIPKGIELCLGQRMVLIRASDKISGKYLTIVLNSNKILKIVKSMTLGSTVPRINMSDIKSYPIPLPPLSEQAEIVRRVEQLFAYADTIEKQVNSALSRANNLTQSILAKAFRGELTAQWRAENPELISGENSAAALLEKIKAERAASTGNKASRKKS